MVWPTIRKILESTRLLGGDNDAPLNQPIVDLEQRTDHLQAQVGFGTARQIYWKPYQYELATELGRKVFDGGEVAAFEWSPDGRKFYRRDNDDVLHQHTAATPHVETSLTADGVTLDLSEEVADARAFHFKPDGLAFFQCGTGNIYQYTLATAWDLATATFAELSVDVSAQVANPQDVAFRPDGLRMYVLADAAVYQYTLATAWDVSTATYDTVTLDISSEEDGAESIDWSADGRRMFIMGANDGHNLIVYEVSAANAWNLEDLDFEAFQALTPSNCTFHRWAADGLTLSALSEGFVLATHGCARPYAR